MSKQDLDAAQVDGGFEQMSGEGMIFRLHGPAYLTTFGASLSHEQKQALRAIGVCRTAALGGHVDQCDRCGYRKIAYCSCRNRQ